MAALTNPQHEAFALAYVATYGNGAEAARRAGYAEGNARQQAFDLLQRDDVYQRVSELSGECMAAAQVNVAEVLAEMKRLAYVNVSEAFDPLTNDLLPVHEMPEHVQRAISSVKIEALYEGAGKSRRQIGHTKTVTFWNKGQGLEMLARTQALFKDSLKVETGGAGELDENMRAARIASLIEIARQREANGEDLV